MTSASNPFASDSSWAPAQPQEHRLLLPSLLDIVVPTRTSAQFFINSAPGEPFLSLRLWSNQTDTDASREVLEYMNVSLPSAVDNDLYVCIFTHYSSYGYRCEIAAGGPPADFMGYL